MLKISMMHQTQNQTAPHESCFFRHCFIFGVAKPVCHPLITINANTNLI